MQNITWQEIQKLVTKAMQETAAEKSFTAGKDALSLQYPSFDEKEILEALDCMLTGYVTMGKKVQKFEKIWADYVGTNFCTMMNSGSSANLLALDALKHPNLANHINPGDEVIIPAVTWSTTLFPIIQVGAKAVLVDIEAETLNINPKKIEEAIGPNTKVLMPVHLLGNPCDMPAIMNIAKKHNLFVIEDTCESHGAEVGGKKVGSFGDLSTFSFMFAHHMTTVEGGSVNYSRPEFDDILRPMRAHGWIRELRSEKKQEWMQKYPEIDPRFLFCAMGYNVRMNDVQGAFGIHQAAKLEAFIATRRQAHQMFIDGMKPYEEMIFVQKERPGTRHTSYALSMVLRPKAPFTRKEFMDFLEAHKIETRPIAAGLLSEQPMWDEVKNYCRISGDLAESHLVHKNGMFIGNNQELTEAKMGYILEVIADFMKQYK